MSDAHPRTLLAVLSNPPLTDGRRTLQRVEQAADVLGFDHVVVGNLFALPSHATGDITALGVSPEGWTIARTHLADHLAACDGALVAFGVSAPAGDAREHFRNQVRWLLERTVAVGLPTWQVGDGPRHPSRWQRWTSRTHPDLHFREALQQSLVRIDYVPDQRQEHATSEGPAMIDPALVSEKKGS